ncbi:hypothetical protein EHS13_29210 [Paenibacillus psychroresistens]|uniref:Peptidase A2 domain-containing protein n=1 Tax=Paenibacillus psychroresistens TaxID=1778678 RepID=A0A6B8RSG6_9BACL|nr:retropepsin-like aspartic protease [Paenibacillus psychroresistens]QGQ98672.1 hypothetical protein EHS13_29210 [Paenibacillus psychroresistens]
MKLNMIYGLPFVDAVFSHRGKEITVSNVLIDTGSATTLLSAEIALELGLEPELTDTIQTMRGVGGKEFVYEKNLDKLTLDSASILEYTIQIGDMDYGIHINAIIGTDFLTNAKIVVDLSELEIYVKVK